jgi:hypothetical protein
MTLLEEVKQESSEQSQILSLKRQLAMIVERKTLPAKTPWLYTESKDQRTGFILANW